MQTAYDVLIVGAGPAGATAATLLARAGWSVAVVEKQAFPRRKVCGECIAASNLPLLQALGIDLAAFKAAAGAPLRRVAVLQGAQQLDFDLPAAPRAGMEWGHALGRETLDPLLLDLAREAGAVVWQPWAVDALEGGPGAFRCSLRNATATTQRATLTAPLAILANGSWEPLPAQRAQRRTERRASDLFAFKANFRAGVLPPGLLPVLSFAGGYGGMVVAGAGVLTLACCVRADRLEQWRRACPGQSAGEAVQAMLRREVAGVDAALRTAVREHPWMASGPLHPGVHLRANDAVLRIGNAAAEAHPIIGEGMSMAMQSAWLLCAQLLEDGTAPHQRSAVAPRQRSARDLALWQGQVARRYARLWHRQFGQRLRMAALLAHAAMRPRWSAPVLQWVLQWVVQQWPALPARGVEWCGKTRTVPDAATIARLAAQGRAAPVALSGLAAAGAGQVPR